MNEELRVAIDDKDIRFTPDGKVAALDAINALVDQLVGHISAERIWEEFRRDNPDVDCTEYTFSGDEAHCVLDRQTVERFEDWLFLYTLEKMQPVFSSTGRI